MKLRIIILSVFCLAVASSGCTKKRVEGVSVPVKRDTKSEITTAPGDRGVVKGDTLWGISGSSDAYSDNMLWPLIFKYNRDSIKDPDLIYPGQNLKIQKKVSSEESSKARKAASDTPPYQPHSTPRQTLPLDYF